ncbi:T-cell surface glycoprotein CD3 zeta chain-like isoform X2 [Toxotes jaculatrix]|uniref:T-cell surface glycoprotein CD3 zeta chain-like isoform X2 n=1 Tax=Toxotes jaculatrix TaxID=941984 RepID=UPI001B3B038B|nr:T-cell surface glycoprotein CD3 zeta chain-like isoform X2 [Toxotes jaculatrix]
MLTWKVLLHLNLQAKATVEGFFTNPIICYVLDGFLIVYCICATALFVKEKYSHKSSVAFEMPDNQEDNCALYQELERPKDADPYQVLEPSKRKKKAGKKKKSQSAQPVENGSLVPSVPSPPASSQ